MARLPRRRFKVVGQATKRKMRGGNLRENHAGVVSKLILRATNREQDGQVTSALGIGIERSRIRIQPRLTRIALRFHEAADIMLGSK